jgi:hypothetical protein
LNVTSNSYPFSRYGAIWFSHFPDSITKGESYRDTVFTQCLATVELVNYSSDCTRFDGVGYTIQYNQTALHGALLFENLANEALVRHGSNISDIRVVTTIAPFPVTKIEERIGAGTDAFLVWFLVSSLSVYVG